MTKLAKKHNKALHGTSERPRLSVLRTNNAIYIQAIDDEASRTLLQANSKEIKGKQTPVETATKVGELLAAKAKDKKIKNFVFDRNGYRYHGQVKALAEGIRKGGINI